MKFVVSSRTHAIVVVRESAQVEFADETIPVAEIHVIDGKFGRAVLQEVATGPYMTMHDFFDIRERCSLQFKAATPVLQVAVCLQGDLHVVMAGIGEVQLKQGQFTVLYVPLVDTSFLFAGAAELLTFNLHIPVDAMHHLMTLFPLQGFMDEVTLLQPALLFDKPGWVTNEILKCITALLGFLAAEPLREYYFSLKVQELLLLFLQQKFYTGDAIISDAALEAVRHAKHIMESHVGSIPGLDAIALLVGMDMIQLREDFKIITGMSMQVFLLRSRMNNARLLILETELAISEVATISGYARPEDFNQAFKQNFGYTPLSLRKERS